MLEGKLWSVLSAHKPHKISAWRIESGKTALGVADLLYRCNSRSGWIENKTAELNDGRLWIRETVKPQQADFLESMEQGGALAHVLLWWQVDDRHWWIMVDPVGARRMVNLRTMPAHLLLTWGHSRFVCLEAPRADAVRRFWDALLELAP